MKYNVIGGTSELAVSIQMEHAEFEKIIKDLEKKRKIKIISNDFVLSITEIL
jgi:hypothetical protein